MAARISHIGLCVSDRDWSLRFFTEGLGFEEGARFALDDQSADAAEMKPGIEGQAIRVEQGGTCIELLHYEKPKPHGSPSMVRSQLGLTHLAFEVDDLAETSARLEALGATILESTRCAVAGGPAVVHLLIVADRDGNRYELMERRPAPS